MQVGGKRVCGCKSTRALLEVEKEETAIVSFGEIVNCSIFQSLIFLYNFKNFKLLCYCNLLKN